MEFHIENMTCGGCARSVTKAIQRLDPAATVKAKPETRRLEVRSSIPRDAILRALVEAGYPASP